MLRVGSPASKRRRWMFRLAAIGLSLLPLAVVEIALRAAGIGERSELVDPYVGFTGFEPLFVRSGDRFQTNESRLTFFRPTSFPAEKGAREFRIFCLGGSTVQGRPYAIETAFSTWLELSLQAADPRRDWRVINCGGISYASYRLVPLLREALQHEPDLIVLYTGHNEFLEDRTYGDIKATPKSIRHLNHWTSRFHLYNWARSVWVDPGAETPIRPAALPAEVDAMLDYRNGLADYHREDDWRAGAIEHFRFNLHLMIESARRAGVPVLLVDPVENVRDCPPFKSANDESLSAASLADFDALWEEGRRSDELSRRTEVLRQAVEVDPRHAAAAFALAKCYDSSGDTELARQYYIQAKDEDICPLRMIEPLHDAVVEVAAATATPLVAVRPHFESLARDGIPGDDWLLDHVHPSINGHQEIAQLLLDAMISQGWVDPQADWQAAARQRYDAHLESLPAAYFAHGQQRLNGLRAWTQGLSPKEKPQP